MLRKDLSAAWWVANAPVAAASYSLFDVAHRNIFIKGECAASLSCSETSGRTGGDELPSVCRRIGAAEFERFVLKELVLEAGETAHSRSDDDKESSAVVASTSRSSEPVQ
mmetsp:Transcript_341/g.728  ORF Transcript_341/g.728 Transcript_341/m.728 type:complete len:110 (-) Transcript_341:817-1146(-)